MPTEHHTMKKINIIKRLVYLMLGALIMAYALESTLVPNNLIDGGVTGISMLLAHITPIKLSIYLVLLNLPFIYLGYKQIGKTFTISMVFGIIALSVFTRLFHHVEPLVKDPFLAIVYGGLLLGVGVGLAMRGGGCLDGTESLAILIDKKVPFSVGEIILVINVFIFSVAAFVFGLESALASALTYYIASKTIDIVVRGFDDMKSVFIISDKPEELAEVILNRLGRGVTFFDGNGAFSGQQKKIILCAFTRLEETKLKDIIHENDPNAFVISHEVAGVYGGRFKKKDIH